MGKIIAVAAQKGGVAKTTTVLTLGAGLVKAGKKVLLLDADPQGSLTFSLGFDRTNLPITLGKAIECAINGIPVSTDTFLHHQEGMDLVPSNRELAAVEMQLPQIQGSLTSIKKFLGPIRDQYDYILIDCMPSLGSVTIASLVAAGSVLIPVVPEWLGIDGLQALFETMAQVRRKRNRSLSVEGLLITRMSSSGAAPKEYEREIRNAYKGVYRVFDTTIMSSIYVPNACAHGVSVLTYARNRKVTKQYLALTQEVLQNG